MLTAKRDVPPSKLYEMNLRIHLRRMMPVAVRTKDLVYGRSIPGIVGPNPS